MYQGQKLQKSQFFATFIKNNILTSSGVTGGGGVSGSAPSPNKVAPAKFHFEPPPPPPPPPKNC